MAADIAPGTSVRLEVAEDPIALAARARENPKATFLLSIDGLLIGERDYRSAGDTIARAESAVRLVTRLA